MIFDAGVTSAGKIYVNAIRSVLGDRQPAMLCLTHCHWDHCGTAAYLKQAFPEMKIAATARGAGTIKRPNALALIRMLNDATLKKIAAAPVDPSYLNTDPFAPFEIDIDLQDGQVISLADGTIIEVLATPGHTQDHHSFWLPGEKILFAGEAAGVFYSHDTITTEFAMIMMLIWLPCCGWQHSRWKSFVRDTIISWPVKRKSALFLPNRFAKPPVSKTGLWNCWTKKAARWKESSAGSKRNAMTATSI